MECHLSKSRYCRGYQCPKMLWMDNYKIEEQAPMSNEQVLENGTEVGELARGLFGEYVNIDRPDDKNANAIMIEKTQEAIKNNIPIITEASFSYNNNFCSVDILKKYGDHFEIYEVKSSTGVHDIYYEDASYQYYVLTKAGYNVTKVCIVHINSNYVRHGELDLKQLFTIEDVTDTAIMKQSEIESIIKHLKEVVENSEEPQNKIGINCFDPYECQYWEYCTKNLPKPNVFDLHSTNTHAINIKTKMQMFYDGKVSYNDLEYEDLPNDTLKQIEHEIKDIPDEIDKDEIRDFMSTLSYPLYFLDFETYQKPIPEYDNMKPFQQIPFQYSLHYILEEGGKLHHKEFLAQPDIDPRRSLAEQLVKDIPMNVCTTAYNMGFEKGRIREMAEVFPDLSEHLLNIRENIKDLMIPFQKRHYYTRAMQGSFSIKYVLPALYPDDPSLNYHNLDEVHNGSEASATYINLGKKSKEEQEKTRANMLKYCGLDTYAMVKVWEKLKEAIK